MTTRKELLDIIYRNYNEMIRVPGYYILEFTKFTTDGLLARRLQVCYDPTKLEFHPMQFREMCGLNEETFKIKWTDWAKLVD